MKHPTLRPAACAAPRRGLRAPVPSPWLARVRMLALVLLTGLGSGLLPPGPGGAVAAPASAASAADPGTAPAARHAAAPAPAAEPAPPAADAASAPLPPAERPPARAGLLWKVHRGPDGPPPSHLFGTVHVDDPRLIARLDEHAPTRQALRGARLLMLELLPSQEDGAAFLQATRLPSSSSLSTLAGPELAERVLTLLATRYQLPREAGDRLQPWAAYLFLNQPARPMGEILDHAVLRRAREAGLRLGALESLSAQLGALQSLPLSVQLTLLDQMARQHDAAQAAIPTLIEHYLAEDLDGLAALPRQSLAGDARVQAAQDTLLEHLVLRRNHGMVERLEAPLKEGGVFVAVGALHLHGEQGLPALLARAGWTVERVR